MFTEPHLNIWRVEKNSQKLCKSSTTSRVFITVSNSPNPPCVLMRLCKHGKSANYCLTVVVLFCCVCFVFY